MPPALRIAVVLALALAPAPAGLPPLPGAGQASLLRATLRPSPGTGAPAWLEQAVCQRAAELGAGCAAVARAVAQEALEAGLEPTLVLAIIEVESGWDPGAVSPRDARGLMQLRQPALDGEAARGRLASADAHDPLVNVRAGIRYFSRLLHRFQDPDLALVAYNAGPNRVAAYLRAEEGVPERFWDYPRRVRREERRLRARLEAPLLAASGAARVRAE